jgi:hypothetical protein
MFAAPIPAVQQETRESGPVAAARAVQRRSALRRLLLCTAAIVVPHAAGAFTFSDGTTMHCFAAGQPVAEYEAPPKHPLVAQRHAGVVERDGVGYRIAWNTAVISTLPPEVHDFIFFHECAHASVPTQDELLANCVGLKTMRAVGRAGFAVETRLGAFYGRDNTYWRETLACADAPDKPPPPVPH